MSLALPKVPKSLPPDVDPIRETPVCLALLHDGIKLIARLMRPIMRDERFADMPSITN